MSFTNTIEKKAIPTRLTRRKKRVSIRHAIYHNPRFEKIKIIRLDIIFWGVRKAKK